MPCPRSCFSSSSISKLLALMAATPALWAANLTWDITSGDGTTITAGSGTWDANSTTAWNNAGTNVKWTSSLDSAIFAGTDAPTDTFYDVSVVGTVGVVNLTFNNSGYRLTAASPVTINGTGVSTITVASGKTATIGQNITMNRSASPFNFVLTGAGTLNVEGKLDETGGTNSHEIKGGATVNIKSTGQLNGRQSMLIGNDASGATLNVDGAVNFSTTATTGNFVINNSSGAVVVNVNNGGRLTSGAGTSGGLSFRGTGTATLNLESGGLVTVPTVAQSSGNGTLNFNGGTLKAMIDSTTFMTGLTNTFVKSGGAKVDSNGKTVTIAQALKTDAVSTGGGFEKLGAGTLTLSGANTYTGGTKVSAGTLSITGSITDSSGIDVATGATFTKGDAVAAFSKAFTLAEGATVNGGALGIGANSVTVSGNLADGFTSAAINNFTKGGGLRFDLTNPVAGLYTVFSGTSITNNFTSVSIGLSALADQGGGVFLGTIGALSYKYTDGSNSLEIQAIPEPAAWSVLAGIGVLTLSVARRRHLRR